MYVHNSCILGLCGFLCDRIGSIELAACMGLNLSAMRSHVGSTVHTFTVDGLSVDWVNGKLYWTDATLQHIEVYDTTTKNRRVLIRTRNTTKPRAIVVDPSTR